MLGLILGFIYLRTDSLYATILLHGFNNAIAMTLLLFGMESLTDVYKRQRGGLLHIRHVVGGIIDGRVTA